MITKLPEWKGYTVDVRLRQFRKVDKINHEIEFVEFDDEQGDDILCDIIKNCKDKEFLSKIYESVV